MTLDGLCVDPNSVQENKPTIHVLKIKKEYADDICFGNKRFEVRYNDRDYKIGDIIRFKVIGWKTHPLMYSDYVIEYIFSGYGLKKRYVILGIRFLP